MLTLTQTINAYYSIGCTRFSKASRSRGDPRVLRHRHPKVEASAIVFQIPKVSAKCTMVENRIALPDPDSTFKLPEKRVPFVIVASSARVLAYDRLENEHISDCPITVLAFYLSKANDASWWTAVGIICARPYELKHQSSKGLSWRRRRRILLSACKPRHECLDP